MDEAEELQQRYGRQIAFEGLGLEGQRALRRARVLVVGVGGLGSWSAELLARAGVGGLRLVDADRVELVNLHRQGLYDEPAARRGGLKVKAAAQRISQINSRVRVEPAAERLTRDTIARLAGDADLLVDGSDNFATRFLINDYCVMTNRPWVFGGVVQAQGQVMTIPGAAGPCLRCVFEQPPDEDREVRAITAGVLGTAVAAVAALQAGEALKILAGRLDLASPYLLRLDLWNNQLQRIDVRRSREGVECPCCGHRRFEFLQGGGASL
jgi:adenylyltransferase/sulfurtransferase